MRTGVVKAGSGLFGAGLGGLCRADGWSGGKAGCPRLPIDRSRAAAGRDRSAVGHDWTAFGRDGSAVGGDGIAVGREGMAVGYDEHSRSRSIVPPCGDPS